MTNLTDFDAVIDRKSLLKHPFYQKWSAGELTMDDMKVYALEYFHLAKAVPGFVDRVRDRARVRGADAKLLAQFDQNFAEETEHIDLWKRFAASLGISEAELDAYVPCETVKQAVRKIDEACERSYEEGVAAMYALEKELPAIAQTKKEGLQAYYGLHSEDAHIYFDEHLKEAKHIAVWTSIDLGDADVADAVHESLAGQNGVLDGVCEEAGICMECAA